MKVALQLFSLKNYMNENGLCAALDKAKELGFDGVEFAGLFGLTPLQAKEELDKRGLECAGFHEGWANLYPEMQNAIEEAKACNAFSLSLAGFWSATAVGYAEFAKQLDEVGARFKQAGIPFGYHNHPHEFETVDGVLPIDVIMENTTKGNVFFEMDTRHIVVAGYDPVDFAKKYAGRITVIHARDTDGEIDCAVGAGKVDFPGVVKYTGVPEWFVVENENFDKNEKDLADSVTYLKNTFDK